MSRRVRYQVAASLDGFIAGPNGEYDWIVMDPAIDFAALFEEFDTAVMGRKTYEVLTAQGGDGAMPGLDVVVFSRTLPTSTRPGIRILDDDPDEIVAALKAKPGRDIWLYGGGSLFRSLLDAGLVDTVEVAVVPVLLGAGVPLLPPGATTKLVLADQKTLSSGIVALSYSVPGGVGPPPRIQYIKEAKEGARTNSEERRSSPEERSRVGGFSPARLARMHDTLLRHVDSGRLPGLVALISRRGAEHVDAIGTLAFDRTAPMRRDTIFRLASVTKPITAVAAMVLVEECKLRLDDPVDEFLPELANRKVLRTIDSELDDTVPAKRPITVRDLLTFRSGYGEVAFLSPACPLQRALIEARLPLSAWMFPGTHDEFMQCLGRLPLANQPGERWLYHMSAEILGVLIARASGQSLSAFMRERLFEPLCMNDTGFTVPEAQLDRVATCYQTDFSSGEVTVLEKARSDLLARPCVFESGAGDQFLSTADDLLAFGRMMLNRGVYGKGRILSRLAVELMTTDQLTPEQKAASPFFEGFWDSRGWGLGLSIVTRRDDVAGVPGRFGWDGAFSTSLYVDPREDMVGVLMAQCRPGALRLPPVVLDFWTSVYQAIDD